MHKNYVFGTTLPVGSTFNFGLQSEVRWIPESRLGAGDPRALAVEMLRGEHPKALPIWLEVVARETFGAAPSHTIPLPGGANARFGWGADQSTTF